MDTAISECASLPCSPALPRWCSGKESAGQSKRHRFHPWVGKILWRRKWQLTPVFLLAVFFSWHCLENPMDRGAWQVTVHEIAESDTTEWLSMHAVHKERISSLAPDKEQVNSFPISPSKNPFMFHWPEWRPKPMTTTRRNRMLWLA